jgi:uncharacterized protein
MPAFAARPALALLPLIAAATLVLPSPVQGQTVDPAKAALIRRLLDVTKTAAVAVSAMEAQMPAQRAAMPQVPPEFWDEFAIRARKEMPRLVELMVPIYDQHFSTEQLRALLAFYESPLGRHFISVQPAVTTQSIQAGQQWGAQLGAEIAADLQRRGIRVPE